VAAVSAGFTKESRPVTFFDMIEKFASYRLQQVSQRRVTRALPFQTSYLQGPLSGGVHGSRAAISPQIGDNRFCR